MALSTTTYALSKKYTDKTVEGLGVIKGADCRIESITPTGNGNIVVFSWTGTSGTKETASLNVENGTSITKVTVDNNNNLIVDFSDGSSMTAGNIKTIKGDKGDTGDAGKDGFSPTVTITSATAMHTVSITDVTGVQSFVVKDGTPVDMQDYYTKTEINNQLNLKADKTSIPVVPTNLSAFANDVNFINNTVDNLVNYYKKTETYTQSEINTLISNINKLTTEIVQSLPTSSIRTTIIYLVPGSGKQDVYSQYMYINSAWALLGETTIDLTNFYTKTEVDNKLSSKADISSIPVVPTNVSQFNNDAGYITGYTETDPTVPAWAKQATKPTYTAQEVGALPDNTVIPVFTNKTVLDKITSTNVASWDDAAIKSHEHTNKTVLDKFSDVNGTVLYNGSTISGGGASIDDTSTTATDKTWSAKKINDSIPTTLPANGGNADTVDGKHASDFMQNLRYLTTGSLLDYVLTLTSSGSFFISGNVTDTPISGLFYGVDVIRHTGGDYVITATRFNGGGVWTNRYNAGMAKWYGWANVADGGNAASVGGKTITVTDVDPGAGSALNTGALVFVTEVT